MRAVRALAVLILAAWALAEPNGTRPLVDVDRMQVLPGDLSALPDPGRSSPSQAAKIELGQRLFFDARLSLDYSMSCATCHDPAKGFADGLAVARGFGGKALRRHSPTVLNATHNSAQFWDGRANSLESQAIKPIMAGDEMNIGSEERLIERLGSDSSYVKRFREIYGMGPDLKLVGDAIAAFESTLVTPDAPFDRYVRGDKRALTASAKRGLALFVGKAACSQCHLGVNFTDNEFHNLGITSPADLGRFEVTNDPADKGRFKTPTLRNVEITAPYHHDGSMKTLEDVVDFYDRGGGESAIKSDRMFELDLAVEEKRDLVAFLKSLTGTVPQIARRH